MIKICVYLQRPGSREIERFLFDSERKAISFEVDKICQGWTGVAGPDLPKEIEVPCYEQLSLF